MTTLGSGGNSFVSNREKETLIKLLERDIELYGLRMRLAQAFRCDDLELYEGIEGEMLFTKHIIARLCPDLEEQKFENCQDRFWLKAMDLVSSMKNEVNFPESRKRAATELIEYALATDWNSSSQGSNSKTTKGSFGSKSLAKLFITTSLLCVLGACSFKSSESDSKKNEPIVSQETVITDPKDDSDGDKITDGEEITRGTNPFIADIPQLQVRFLQNYSISFFQTSTTENMSSTGEVRIETAFGRINPDFKYRVGEVMLRDRSFQSAASIGKFDSHSWGEITRQDLTWVKYPEIDPAFYHAEAMRVRPYFEKGSVIEGLKVNLENTFKLLPNSRFKEIKNLTLAFRYYDYERETFELLHQTTVARVLQAGIAETISVEIENIPENLIADNYLKKGEFIISEVVDFDIPELDTTYKTLMASVSAKSIPVLITTPLETRVAHVALPKKTARFQEILRQIFVDKFMVVDNRLQKVEQFENNLGSYTYLKEIKDQDKKGKWFVFTDKLLRHYLEHNFTRDDVISISYVTGKELATQAEEKVYAYYPAASGNEDYVVYPLGNISPNSEVDLQIEGNWLSGDKLTSFKEEFHSNGAGCRGNCSTSDIHCFWDVNKFEVRNEPLFLKKDYSGEFDQIKLVINRSEFLIKELIEKKLVTPRWEKNSLNLNITDVNTIQEIEPFSENVIALKVSTHKGDTFNGIKLAKMTGKQSYYCPAITTNFAFSTKLPISDESLEFPKWRSSVHWDKIKLGKRKQYSQPFSLSVSSTVKNYHN